MLMTAARFWIAFSIWFAERENVICSGSGTLRARAFGHTPTMPRPFCGAAATDAVAVPCELVTGNCGVVFVLLVANSGWLLSSCASTSAISGLVAVTGGGVRAGSATSARQLYGVADSGSFGTLASGWASVPGCAYTSRSPSAAANARAWPRAITYPPAPLGPTCSAPNRLAIRAARVPGFAPTIQVLSAAATDAAVASPGSTIGGCGVAAADAAAGITRRAAAVSAARQTFMSPG